jgi:hypothetical protein
MQMMAQRALSRRVFGKLIAEQGSFISDIERYIDSSLCYRIIEKIYVTIHFKNRNKNAT